MTHENRNKEIVSKKVVDFIWFKIFVLEIKNQVSIAIYKFHLNAEIMNDSLFFVLWITFNEITAIIFASCDRERKDDWHVL